MSAETNVVDVTDDALESMSMDDLAAYERGELAQSTEGNADEASDDETDESEQVAETPEDDDDSDKVEVVSEKPGKAEPATEKEVPEHERPNYKALQGIIEKIQREKDEKEAKLQGYQKLDADYQRVQTMVNDPRFAKFFVDNALGANQPQMQYPQQNLDAQNYDYTDPKTIDQIATSAAQRQFNQFIQLAQANARRQKDMEYVNTVSAKKARIVAEHAVDPTVLENYILDLNRRVAEGDVADIAFKIATYDEQIAKAKKDAIGETQKKLTEASNRPKRATGASVGKQTFAETKNLNDMTDDELVSAADSIIEKDPSSPKLEKIMNIFRKRGL